MSWSSFPWFLIPFGVFFVCCVLQFPFLRDIRRRLVSHHPETWAKISNRAWFVDNAVGWFAFKRGDKALGDPGLTRTVRRFKMLMLVAYAAWFACAAVMIFGHGLDGLNSLIPSSQSHDRAAPAP